MIRLIAITIGVVVGLAIGLLILAAWFYDGDDY
jgi:hypothetical protein